MMDFSDPPRRRLTENLLPMINVVFLMLVFFLISARIMPPEPFAVTLPEAVEGQESEGMFVLLVAADGQIGYRDTTGQAAQGHLKDARQNYCASNACESAPPQLILRADAALNVAALSSVLSQMAEIGFTRIDIVTRSGDGR